MGGSGRGEAWGRSATWGRGALMVGLIGINGPGAVPQVAAPAPRIERPVGRAYTEEEEWRVNRMRGVAQVVEDGVLHGMEGEAGDWDITYALVGTFALEPFGYSGTMSDGERAALALPVDSALYWTMMRDDTPAVRAYAGWLLAQHGEADAALGALLIDDAPLMCDGGGCVVTGCTVAEAVREVVFAVPVSRPALDRIAREGTEPARSRAAEIAEWLDKEGTLEEALVGIDGVQVTPTAPAAAAGGTGGPE